MQFSLGNIGENPKPTVGAANNVNSVAAAADSRESSGSLA